MTRVQGGPLRLAVFSYGLPVAGQKRGGIERVAHDLAQGLARKGHDVTVWSYDPRPSEAAYQVRRLPWERFVQSWFGRRVTMGYLGNVLATLPDYGEAEAVIALGDSLFLPLKGKPVVRVMCGSALGEAMSATSPWRFAMQTGVFVQELLSAATQRWTIGISENTRKHNPFVRRVIPIGVDLSLFHPAAGERAPVPTILFVGTLSGRKRGALLVQWFGESIRKVHPDAELVIVGPPGPDYPGVRYATGVSMEELARLYREAWVYASPSRYEGFGLPYVEAMASGTPVIATPNPGSREVLEGGRFGLLPTDAEFPEAVLQLLGDESRRRALAVAGLARAERYSVVRVVDEYEDLLFQIARGSERVMAEPVTS